MRIYTTIRIEATKGEKETIQNFINFFENMGDNWYELCRACGESNMDIMYNTAEDILNMMED